MNAFKKVSSESDLIILLGVRLSLYIGWEELLIQAKVIQVDIEPKK